jgi:hypothetical protein
MKYTFLLFATVLLFSIQSYAQQMVIGNGAYVISGVNIVVNCDSLVNRGILNNSGTAAIKLTGNLINQGTFINGQASSVSLYGIATQTIGSSNQIIFSTLNLNNNAGLILEKDATINGNLNFQNGIITTASNLLTLGDTASITNASSSKYVDGKLANTFSGIGTKVFPIGKGGNYRPVNIQLSALSGISTITAEQFETGLTATLPADVTMLSNNRFWTITQSGGSAIQYYISLDASGFTPVRPVVILKKDAGMITSHETTTPNYTNTIPMTTFSDFALGEQCINPGNGGEIGVAQSICSGTSPAVFTSVSLPAGYTGTLEYQWQMNTISSTAPSGDWTLVGSNSATYHHTTAVNQNTWFRRLARVDCKTDWLGAAESNVVMITVTTPLTPSVSITESANNVVSGTSVTFTATPANGGIPIYQWKVNGIDVGTGTDTYTYAPANGDIVKVEMTSSLNCVTIATATSNTISMFVFINNTWQGVTTDWNLASNWSLNTVPLSNHNVIIPANSIQFPTISVPSTINNLTIESGASIIENGLTINGTAIAERYIAKDNNWHFLSSPVVNQEIKPNFAPTTCDQTFDFFKWDQSDATMSTPWLNIRASNGSYATGFDNFEVGKAYLLAYSSNYGGNATHQFTGTLNRGDQANIAVSNSGNTFNLIGNPYPSAIDWDAAGYIDRDIRLKNTNPSIWIWNGTSGNYGTYNYGVAGTNEVTNVIAPNQGFFVEAISTGNFTIPNASRLHPGTQNFLKSTASDLLKLKVSSTANTYSDEIIVNFNSNAIANQGAGKWFSMISDAPSLYSVKNNKNFSINTLAVINTDLAVPVCFKAGVNGYYSIKASELASFTNLSNLILKDLQTGSTQNLLQNQVYNFAANTTDNANRFQLIFNSTLGIVNPTNTVSSVIYIADNVIYIQSKKQIKQIEFYNAIGQLVYKTNAGTAQFSLSLSDFVRGAYFVRITTEQGIQTQKFIINN